MGGEALSVAQARPEDLAADLLILGASTWGYGDLQDDWDRHLGLIASAAGTFPRVALFGTGDADEHGDTFVDALGILWEALAPLGVTLLGTWPTEGYAFAASRALVDGRFVGLPLDEDNQPELSEGRISAWCAQLQAEWVASPG